MHVPGGHEVRKIAALMLFGVISGLAFGQAGGIIPCDAAIVLPTPSTILLMAGGAAFFNSLKK